MRKAGVPNVIDPNPAYALPILADSPHSGRNYTLPGFCFTCPRHCLEEYEDRFVDQLIERFASLGATVITTDVPRSYIDLNRAANDIWPFQLSDPWPEAWGRLKPTYHCSGGTGLIWSHAGNHGPAIYDFGKAPTSREVLHRIRHYYEPYYAVLQDRAARLKKRFGRVWHLNFHSMPPDVNNGRYDIVLGDLDGKSCSPQFLDAIGGAFRACGLRVAVNEPYKGAALTRLFGHPARDSESLQIEISKGLYLEKNLLDEKPAEFANLQRVLESVLKVAGNFALDQLASPKTAAKQSLRASSSSAIDTRLPSAASEVTP